MDQPPVIHLFIQFPLFQLLYVPFFLTGRVDVYCVVMAEMAHKQAVVLFWSVDGRAAP